jgi:hypothetical protein
VKSTLCRLWNKQGHQGGAAAQGHLLPTIPDTRDSDKAGDGQLLRDHVAPLAWLRGSN